MHDLIVSHKIRYRGHIASITITATTIKDFMIQSQLLFI